VFGAHPGRPDLARDWMAQYESVNDPIQLANPRRHAADGAIALAENPVEDAIGHFRTWDVEIGCLVCALPLLAQAYDMAGHRDSAAAVRERYVTTP
jgi:hypothetical protein